MSEAVSTGDLCTHCGLCCTEALFGWVPLMGEADRAIMLRHGYDESQLLPDRFLTPCALLDGKACGVFPDRPSCCPGYRCEVLSAAQDGAMPLDQALDIVRKAVALHDDVQTNLPEGQSLHDARRRWKEADKSGAAPSPDEAPLRLAYYALNLFLDRHFRPAGGELVERLD
ncbi:MAG: YkgJ family cysteine cluster protein [Sphingomonadaceae bacterium]|nr:YkgJ family cysteine cluster protein [Sphingomonadaceae bacterium]